MEKHDELCTAFSQAVFRLDEALAQPKNAFMRDSAIQRFEFTFDLAWKTIQAHLRVRGMVCASPKSCFQEAYRLGLIEHEPIWIDMIEMRNLTSHTYHEPIAEKVYGRLGEVVSACEKLLIALKKPS